MQTIGLEQRVRIHTDWRGYESMIEIVGEQPGLRLTYDRGELEIMTVSGEHERRKSVLACLVENLMLELGLEFFCGGAQTFKRQDLDRGFEPDECYWIRHWREVQERANHDPKLDPPPDLAVEVEVSRGLVNRIGIYQAVGVPEVWRWTPQEELHVLVLNAHGDYERQPRSPTFPDIELEALEEFARRGNHEPTSRVIRALREWVRNHCGS